MSNTIKFYGTENYEFPHEKKIYCSPRLTALDLLKTETIKDGPFPDGVINASTSNPA